MILIIVAHLILKLASLSIYLFIIKKRPHVHVQVHIIEAGMDVQADINGPYLLFVRISKTTIRTNSRYVFTYECAYHTYIYFTYECVIFRQFMFLCYEFVIFFF